MDIDHDNFITYAAESVSPADLAWERWIDEVENLLDQNPDGDQAEDGFSLDGFYELWEKGRTPAEAVGEVGSIAY